jgi:hypothetical protein
LTKPNQITNLFLEALIIGRGVLFDIAISIRLFYNGISTHFSQNLGNTPCQWQTVMALFGWMAS